MVRIKQGLLAFSVVLEKQSLCEQLVWLSGLSLPVAIECHPPSTGMRDKSVEISNPYMCSKN